MNNPTENSGSKNLTPSLSDLDDVERQDRVRALQSMLAATEIRQKRVRPPPLEAGLPVQIRSGINQGAKGIILDADYIHSRVLVELLDSRNDTWVKFTEVTPVADPDEGGSNPL
jgi:hypothetical protein